MPWKNCLYFFQLFFRRVGRRKILMISFLVAAVGAIGALLLTDKAEDDQGTSSLKSHDKDASIEYRLGVSSSLEILSYSHNSHSFLL